MPLNPDDDDLVALADAVREGRENVAMAPPVAGFSDPSGVTAHATLPGASMMQAAAQRPAPAGRRRGHLRVLPDPAD
jgi:hypothetical protein